MTRHGSLVGPTQMDLKSFTGAGTVSKEYNIFGPNKGTLTDITKSDITFGQLIFSASFFYPSVRGTNTSIYQHSVLRTDALFDARMAVMYPAVWDHPTHADGRNLPDFQQLEEARAK